MQQENESIGWTDRDADILDEEVTDYHDALTTMDLEGNVLRKVKVKLFLL